MNEATGRKRALFAAKLAITVALCGLIIAYVDWAQFWSTLRVAKLWIIGVVLLMRLGGIALSSFKWQLLLEVHDLRYGLGRLWRWYIIATFFNQLLPTSIGGDGYRLYKTFDNPRGAPCAVSAVFVERLTGFAALLLLGYGAAILAYLRTADPLAAAVALIVSVGLAVGIASAWVIHRFSLLQRIAASRFWPKPLRSLPNLAGDYRSHPGRAMLIGVISFVFHINKLCVVWLLLYSLGATVNVLELAVAVLAVEVVALLPVTLGGLGLMEGSFIYAMAHFGVGNETALAAALLMRVLLVPFSLLGVFFYFVGDRAGESVPSVGERLATSQPIQGRSPFRFHERC
jgi:uncharacterized membrane protein YbhN (UPF0104 family)